MAMMAVTKIIGGVRIYRGTEHPKLSGQRVRVVAVHRFDAVDEDVIALSDDALIQAIRLDDRVEIALLVVAGDGFEKVAAGAAVLASPGDLEVASEIAEPSSGGTIAR